MIIMIHKLDIILLGASVTGGHDVMVCNAPSASNSWITKGHVEQEKSFIAVEVFFVFGNRVRLSTGRKIVFIPQGRDWGGHHCCLQGTDSV